jgi:hypothetical protein
MIVMARTECAAQFDALNIHFGTMSLATVVRLFMSHSGEGRYCLMSSIQARSEYSARRFSLAYATVLLGHSFYTSYQTIRAHDSNANLFTLLLLSP